MPGSTWDGRRHPVVISSSAIALMDAVRAVCKAVGKPVNVLAGSSAGVTVAALGAAGARRISLGSALVRVALSATVAAARELTEHGTFGFSRDVLPYAQVNALLAEDGG